MCHPHTRATYAVLQAFARKDSRLSRDELNAKIREYAEGHPELSLTLAFRAERRLLRSECFRNDGRGGVIMTAQGQRTKESVERYVT